MSRRIPVSSRCNQLVRKVLIGSTVAQRTLGSRNARKKVLMRLRLYKQRTPSGIVETNRLCPKE